MGNKLESMREIRIDGIAAIIAAAIVGAWIGCLLLAIVWLIMSGQW